MFCGVGWLVSYETRHNRYYCLLVRVGFRLQTSKLSVLTQLHRGLLRPSKVRLGYSLKLHCDNPTLRPLTHRHYWITPKEIPYLHNDRECSHKRNLFRKRCILKMKLHVSAFIGHQQVSTIIKMILYNCVRACWWSTRPHTTCSEKDVF